MDLLLVILLNTFLMLVILFIPVDVLRIILGLPFVLVFPGYTLLSALFIRQGSMSGVERLALSCGLSIAVVPIIGLILNYTPWGISLNPYIFTLYFFTIIMSSIAYFRRRSLPENERFYTDFKLHNRKSLLQETASVVDTSHISGKAVLWDRLLSVLLVIVIMLVIGAIVFVIVTPKTGESFTEFYILSPDGKVGNYPKDIILDQSPPVIVGIVNLEGKQTTYRFDVLIEGIKIYSKGYITLQNDEKWQQEIPIKPLNKGANQKVEFYLYKNDGIEPDLKLKLFVNVK